MHTLFLLLALLVAAALGGVGVILLRLVPPGSRRPLAVALLVAPPSVMAAGVFHIVPSFWPQCAPLVGWDRLASLGLLLVVGGTAVGALGLNLARLALVERLLLVCPPLVEGVLVGRVAALARRLGVPPPALRLLEADVPLAFSGGLRQPTIVLSRWLVEQLDRREQEAVLAHELAHLARRDHLMRWLGRLLRDAMAYLPGGWHALGAMEEDQELAADALAVEATRRPLSMASALGRVWCGAMGARGPIGVAGLPGYAGDLALLEERLSRLLGERAVSPSPLRGRLLAGASLVSVGELVPRLLAVGALHTVCNLRPF